MSESKLLAAVANNSAPADKKAYDVRWVNCPEHDQPFIEIWIPSLEVWAASAGCPACKREEETGQPQPRRGQSVEDLRLELSGIPPRFRNIALKNFTGKGWKQPVEIARNFAPGDNLLIVGPIGSGKTSLAAAILAEQLSSPSWPEGSLGQYASTRDVMESLHWAAAPKSWVDGGYNETLVSEFKRLNGYQILILDDLDIHAPEELGWLERILAKRISEKRSTVIIGGPDLDALCAVLGPRILDRLRGWKQISFEGAS